MDGWKYTDLVDAGGEMLTVLIVMVIAGVARAGLPPLPDCTPAQWAALDTAHPGNDLGFNHEIGGKASPARVSDTLKSGPLPTGHFATGHIKSSNEIWPAIQTPYQVLLTRDGAVSDANTMERWWSKERSTTMEQQSAWESGKPWHKLNEMGTNMRQMTSGPDGNPLGVFTGKSGVRIGIDGAGDPTMTSFGELYANFEYKSVSGSMEVPLVRGASLMSHVFKSANPVMKPYCLSSINGQAVKFDCPMEPSGADGGVGFISGSCHGSTLTIFLHSSKEIPDVTKVQWAAETKSNWGNTYMRTCDSRACRLEDGGKTVRITIDGHGVMNYAINYIGHYLLPSDWTHKPGEATCHSKRDTTAANVTMYTNAEERSKREAPTISTTCTDDRTLTVKIHLANYMHVDAGLKDFQYAVEPAESWDKDFVPPMRACTSVTCQHVGQSLVITTKAPSFRYKLAINILRYATIPAGDWIHHPIEGTCGGGSSNTQTTQPPHTPEHTHLPHTTPTTQQQPSQEATLPPPNQNQNQDDAHNWTPDTKFIMELDEPGSHLPQQTRKFVVYFSSPVVPKIDQDSNVIRFEPQNGGGKYSGLVQLAYAGASPRGDRSQASFFDKYAGRFSFKPQVQYCSSKTVNKSFVSFEWKVVDEDKRPVSGEFLSVAMPHQALLLKKTNPSKLVQTPFTFEGYEGADWLMEMDLLHTEVDPDPAGVAKVKADPTHKQEMLAAISRDAANTNLDAICGHSDSYNVGKAIGMATRLASLSRTFGTNHHGKVDTSIKNCLERWLRIQDSLDEMWKFRYDDVWGGLFLRATNGELQFGVDYGFPFYNDHHFHLGYFLYALAYYVKHYPSWGNAHKQSVYYLARDVANPSPQDPHFPVSRQKDLYGGFSWASGIVPGTRQEESASEGINCYHAIAALGDAYNDYNLWQTGQVLLAMEILSVREYWQVRAHNRAHFPPLIQDFGVVGMISEPAFYAYTLNWPCDPNIFPQRHGCLVGIQVIPITAVSRYWMDKEWASSIEKTCQSAIDPHTNPYYSMAEKTSDLSRSLGTGWKAFCHTAMAPLDASHATQAADYVKGRKPQELVGGTGAASTLLFIYGNT